jgi:hypothetical protein
MERWGWVLAAAVVLAACGGPSATVEAVQRAQAPTAASATSTPPAVESPVPADTGSVPVADPAIAPVTARPSWLGTRVLPLRPDGLGEILPTPPELADRRFATVDLLPPPTSDSFSADVAPVPQEVVARSTWTEGCPVGLDELRYVTLPFWGFDGLLHTGELLVHADAVDATVAGFGVLFERRFPIEEMRVVRADELDAPPTGDGNNSSAFVCRPSVGSTRWSEHAYGRAVDINPFHNPYVKGDVVVPELASAYTDRANLRPGMFVAEDLAGFLVHGWGWGGTWSSAKDPMHVSASGG